MKSTNQIYKMMASDKKEFGSAEHESFGEVKLPGLDDTDGMSDQFEFRGGTISFGKIIALAGDYFGVAGKPICEGKDTAERRKRFMEAYQSLANCHPSKLSKLIQDINEEGEVDLDAIKHGKSEEAASASIAAQLTEDALKATHFKYLFLAIHNLDHFGKQARDAFFTGYGLAQEAALEAADTKDPIERQKKLKYAYSLLAFSCHFLTDLFAAGHMRTPRAELEEEMGPEIGSLLTLLQHNEDGDSGLKVYAKSENSDRNRVWTAHGDGHLFEDKMSKMNRHQAKKCLQQAIQEVYTAFSEKKVTKEQDSAVCDLIAKVSSSKNAPPMFKYEDKKLWYRTIPGNNESYVVLTEKVALDIVFHNAVHHVDEDAKAAFESVASKYEGFEGFLKKELQALERKFGVAPNVTSTTSASVSLRQ